jgi:hypothetical protein
LIYGTFRWIHIDGEYSFEGVCNAIGLAMLLMRETALIVVDDFFNIAAANVTHPLSHMLDRNSQCIRMFQAGATRRIWPNFLGVYRATSQATYDGAV